MTILGSNSPHPENKCLKSQINDMLQVIFLPVVSDYFSNKQTMTGSQEYKLLIGSEVVQYLISHVHTEKYNAFTQAIRKWAG